MTECGIIAPDDRVELLDGLIVAMAAQSAPHASSVYRVHTVLVGRLPSGTVIRQQMTLRAGGLSVPEPDIAVVPGAADDYWEEHPSSALLIVEVAYSSLIQDRLTKAAIYARAGIPCYWILNLRDHCVEVHRQPDAATGSYRTASRAAGDDSFEIDAFPGIMFRAAELLPPERTWHDLPDL